MPFWTPTTIFGNDSYLEFAVSSCEHILRDLGKFTDRDSLMHRLFPRPSCEVHNANTLGASLLARTYAYTRNEAYRDLAAEGHAIHRAISASGPIVVLRRGLQPSLGR